MIIVDRSHLLLRPINLSKFGWPARRLFLTAKDKENNPFAFYILDSITQDEDNSQYSAVMINQHGVVLSVVICMNQLKIVNQLLLPFNRVTVLNGSEAWRPEAGIVQTYINHHQLSVEEFFKKTREETNLFTEIVDIDVIVHHLQDKEMIPDYCFK